MDAYELLIAAGAAISALAVIVTKVGKPIADILKKVNRLAEHDNEQYLAILRLTVMSQDMPISERLIAGQKYIDSGGNGDVKEYYERLIVEHTK